MTGDDLKDGKERVRVHLIEPLDRLLGLKRPKRCRSNMEHLAGLAEIQNKLAYLGEPDLLALQYGIRATLTRAGEWPSPAVVFGFAHVLCPPPPSDSEKVVSYMRSSAGMAARAGGYHVDLYRWLKEHSGVPSGPVDLRQIKAAAEQNNRAEARLERMDREGASMTGSEAGFLEFRKRDRARAEALAPVADVEVRA